MGLKKNSYLPQTIIESATGKKNKETDICKLIAGFEDSDTYDRTWKRPGKRLVRAR
jgi:hypothetical protein